MNAGATRIKINFKVFLLVDDRYREMNSTVDSNIHLPEHCKIALDTCFSVLFGLSDKQILLHVIRESVLTSL